MSTSPAVVLSDTPAPDRNHASKDTLALLARIAQGAGGCQGVASLPIQFANELLNLAEYLWIRGESHLEHYYAQALALSCLRPATTDVRGYEMLLLSFIRFDRRQRVLPAAESLLPLNLDGSRCIYFLELLRTQSSFRALYLAAAQIEAYGAMSRSQKKCERIILLSREVSGQPLLAPVSPREQTYLRLALTEV